MEHAFGSARFEGLAASIWHPRRWPAPVVNGVSVGAGLAVLTGGIGLLAGMPAAITAASGAAATSIADTVCAPQAKRSQMIPAVLSSTLVACLVAWAHDHAGWLNAVALLTVFTATMWTAWGKRGNPQTFVMVLTLVFQMAALHQPAGKVAMPVWAHVAWVIAGAVGIAVWAEISIRVLAARYRTVALADSLDALANMMAAQAQWTVQQGQHVPVRDDRALLALVSQQAGIAEVFQQARDLLYSQAGPDTPERTCRQIMALVHTVNLRDVVQSCQLDLDRLPDHPHTPQAVHDLATQLQDHAQQLRAMALQWRHGQNGSVKPEHTPFEDMGDAVLNSLTRRRQHMLGLMQDLAQAQPEPVACARQAPPGFSLRPEQQTVMQTLVSPGNWTLAPLKAQLNPASPVLRYAVRATLAAACAQLMARAMPWASHPHWILMTVAVVMRGNLEQTLARRDARIQGTLVGCLVASAIVNMADHSPWLFLVLAVALSLAHGFVLINYRVTAASGAVLALIQVHLFSSGHHAALQSAAERLGDTVIGALLAWTFSYVLPSWERRQLPALAQRLLRAQSHYTAHALAWQAHPNPNPRRSHARREVYDVLSLLTQSLQRMDKEPGHARTWAPHLERLIIHSHRFISLLAAVRGLLTIRQDALDARLTTEALQRTRQRVAATLQGPLPGTGLDALEPVEDHHDVEDRSPLEDATHTSQAAPLLNDWLHQRLHQTEREALCLAQAASRLQRDTTG